MINYTTHTLSNGLQVIAHQDTSTPMVTVNMLYKVGSRHEQEDKTGFAHLFEHLMFGGSANAPDFDTHVQLAGGECNAYTTSDYTNYYMVLPSQNIETALWLESDRMLNPLLNQDTLATQQSVVIEEFNQRYLNQPYGDVSLLMKPLAYKIHPYRWNTIGRSIDHIREANLDDVQAFFDRFYTPANAVLVLSGNIDEQEAIALAQKWFGDIPARPLPTLSIPTEPLQQQARMLQVERQVPASAIFKAYHMPARLQPHYHACDLITDLLSSGKSSRLFRRLVQEQGLFSSVNAYISGDIDAGLITVAGHLLPHVSMQQANQALQAELTQLCEQAVTPYELDKVKNKVESMHVFAEVSATNKATSLAYAALLGNIELVNTDIDHYRSVDQAQIQAVSRSVFTEDNCSTLYYQAIP